MPDYRMIIYCAQQSHTAVDLGPFRRENPWEAYKLVENTTGVFAPAVMELNRSDDKILAAEMERDTATLGPWIIATDVPAQRMGIHRPQRKYAEMLTLFDEDHPHGRVWIRLKCGLCGLPYERRMPQFCSQLDTLATNGITAVSLRTLIDTRNR